jgi:tRNA pseudouridine38-40 synthase
MPRYKLTIEYDGRNYAGWQKQNDAPSVQGAIINAAFLFCGEKIDVVGAGRTDSNVHATAQVAHLDIPTNLPDFKVMQGINYYLFNPPKIHQQTDIIYPENRIAILDAKLVADDFHARFSAKRRHYLYRIINRRARLGLEAGKAWHVIEPLNEKLMHEAAQILVGHHDFTTFRDTQCQAKSPEKTLELLTVTRRGNELHITASARSFLHHQVRNMVGTLSLVGKGKWSVADVQTALKARDRRAGGPTCPSEGLYLTGVDY